MSALGFDSAPLLGHLEVHARTFDPPTLNGGVLPEDWALVKTMANVAGVSTRTVHRWRRGGRVGPDVADRCAVALGLHPLLLWPDW